MMRNVLACGIILLFAGAGLLAAQDDGIPAELAAQLKRIGIDEAQYREIVQVRERTERTIRTGQAELLILRGRIEKELLGQKPDVDAVEALVRQAAGQEADIRMAQIRRELEMQRILGDRKWALFRRQIRERSAGSDDPNVDGRNRDDRSRDSRDRDSGGESRSGSGRDRG